MRRAAVGVIGVIAVSVALALRLPAERPVSAAPSGRIAFDDDGRDVWVVNADGSRRRRLTADPAPELDPTWSPDGTRVAYRSEVDGNAEIYVMNADGSGKRNLTRNPAEDYSPAWSPSGKRIAFASSRGGVFNDVYVTNVDGSRVRRVTRHLSVDEYPSWSPNGKRLTFASDRAGRWEIYVIDLDGTHERRLTRRGGKAPAWSPRGSLIAYQGPSSSTTGDHGMNALWLVRADGRQPRRVARTAFSPAWRPDGGALVASRPGRGLILLGLSGDLLRRIASGPAVDADWERPRPTVR
jgi:tol-pal system beta propeller repeat protein TolB